MSHETDHGPELPQESEGPATSIDPHRANQAQRELERWLFYGGDEREMSGRRGLPSNWRDSAKLVGTIIYDHETTRYEGFGEGKTPVDNSQILSDEE